MNKVLSSITALSIGLLPSNGIAKSKSVPPQGPVGSTCQNIAAQVRSSCPSEGMSAGPYLRQILNVGVSVWNNFDPMRFPDENSALKGFVDQIEAKLRSEGHNVCVKSRLSSDPKQFQYGYDINITGKIGTRLVIDIGIGSEQSWASIGVKMCDKDVGVFNFGNLFGRKFPNEITIKK